jgi:polysaccharide pyruvyl transferase WcaK-like protein
MVSVIIAAYDEEATVGTTLDALLTDAPEAEVIVVPNGCTDRTAEVARSRPGVRVIEVATPGKAHALNVGDAAARTFPRIYLDADIRVPRGCVAALVHALEQPGVLAAVPGRRLATAGRPWLVRAHSRVHERLPVFRDGLFGRGMIAVSEVGRARFDSFPELVADDLFLDSVFTPDETSHVDDVAVTIETPATTRQLVHRLERVRRGSRAMRDAGAAGRVPGTVRRPSRSSWLRDVVAHDPRLVPAGAAYGAVTFAAALGARRPAGTSPAWRRTDVPARPEKAGRIGFLGIQADTANLGLAALAYSSVDIVDGLTPPSVEFVLFSINSDEALDRMRRELDLTRSVRAVPFWHKRPRAMAHSVREIRGCDLVVDLTGGDSFSDIYGSKRLVRKLFHKELVLTTGTPLVLGPQTYGPLRHRVWAPWYRHVIRRAALVVTRDELSATFLASLTDRPVQVSTDVAVTLPWTARERRERPCVAFNVSGLLWNGGYTGANQFSLRTDYREYCRGVVTGLLAEGYDVELVPHVLTRHWEGAVEDDVTAARELIREHPDCALAPPFVSPVDAKSHLATADVFIGSRMHASIAAFTAGVPTIPAAYSRKFAGFFGHLGYPVLVDLAETDTETAVQQTLTFAKDHDRLAALAGPAREAAQESIQVFIDHLRKVVGTVLDDC